jgi:hypothetical protein
MNNIRNNVSPASRSAVIDIIEALRERHQSKALAAAAVLAGLAKRRAQKQSVKATWANVAGPARASAQGDPYRLVGLIRSAHEISDEDFDRQVSDILDMRQRVARSA